MKKSKLARVAILQLECEDGEVEENFSRVKARLEKLRRPLDLLLLPEMWPSGFRLVEGRKLLQQTKGALEQMAAYAREMGCYVIGSHLTSAPRGFYNTASILDPRGREIARYHKAHLFALGGEAKKFKPGASDCVANTRLGKIGLAICYDIRFPEFIRKEVLAGAELLAIPSAWPLERIEHYRTLLKARAIENQCFILSANKVGKNAEGVRYGGHSVAIGPWGEVLGELGTRPGLLELEIQLQKVEELRKKFPVLKARREDLYRRVK